MSRLALMFLFAFSTACTSTDDTTTDGTDDVTDDGNTGPGGLGVPDGAEVFADNCAICHADDGSGVNGLGPDLMERVPGLTVEDVESTVTDGTGTMNPVSLFEDETTAVAEYVVDEFGD